MNHLSEVVFQEVLPLGLEERNELDVVHRVDTRQSEVDKLSALVHRNTLYPHGDGPVLVIGERKGVPLMENHLAARGRGDLVQQIPHAAAIASVERQFSSQALRIEEVQLDGLVDRGERLMRALRQRKQPILGQIDPGAGNRATKQGVDCDEQDPGDDETRERNRADP